MCSHPTPRVSKQVPRKRKGKSKALTLKQEMQIRERLEKADSRAALREELNAHSSAVCDIKSQSQQMECCVKSESDKRVEKRQSGHTLRMEVPGRVVLTENLRLAVLVDPCCRESERKGTLKVSVHFQVAGAADSRFITASVS